MKIEINKKIVIIGKSKGVIIPPKFLKHIGVDKENRDITIAIEGDKITIKKNNG